MVKFIIFDIGKVILDFDHHVSIKKLSGLSGHSEQEIRDFIFESGLLSSMEKGQITSLDFYRKINDKFKLDISFNRFKEIWCEIFTPNTSLESLLYHLTNNYRLAVLSNTDEMHLKYIYKRYKVFEVFSKKFMSYELKLLKPDVEVFKVVLETLKTLPDKCIYIDDLEENVKAAQKTGMHAIQYKSVSQLKTDLAKLNVQVN